MPLVAERNGETVWPADVEDDARVSCPACGEAMHVRSAHSTKDDVFRSRCFVHNPEASRCSGGESDEHKLMKYVAYRALLHVFDHAAADREVSIPGTERRADVAVTFEDDLHPVGHGVVAEIQYRNESKDIEAVSREYLEAGYSVYWLDESHFGDGSESVELPDPMLVWPEAAPPRPEWTSPPAGAVDLREVEPDRHPLLVTMPEEYIEAHRTDLRTAWEVGAGDYGLVYRLRSNNATRPCEKCRGDAAYYLFKEEHISIFRCAEHLPIDDGNPAP